MSRSMKRRDADSQHLVAERELVASCPPNRLPRDLLATSDIQDSPARCARAGCASEATAVMTLVGAQRESMPMPAAWSAS
jgi:hypothetical protein